jgi:hypothetical protein
MAPIQRMCAAALLATGLTGSAASPVGAATTSTIQIFPSDNIWNTKISQLPVHSQSATWVAKVSEAGGTDRFAWPGWSYPGYGFFWVGTDETTSRTKVKIVNQDPTDSDTSITYPLTATTPLELGNPDAHALMLGHHGGALDSLFEMYAVSWNGGKPQASATVAWNVTSNALRPDNRSSADEAGLCLFCGLLRWDEVQSGVIPHALRFEATSPHIQGATHLWPARHSGGTGGSDTPPMGARMRLKSSWTPPSDFQPGTLVIVKALKEYGAFLADIGLNWEFQGTCDSAWPSTVISDIFRIPADQFEFVDESSLMLNPNSGQARQSSVADTVPPAHVTDLQ